MKKYHHRGTENIEKKGGKKRNIFPFFLLCVLCASVVISFSGCRKSCFSTDHISGESGSSRLAYRSPDPINGVDFEIIKTKNGSNLYLIVHSYPVSATATAIFQVDGVLYDVALLRHAGGQRMLVADVEILNILRKSKKVIIEVEGYTSELSGQEFEKHYQKMQKPLFITNPFRLPF